MKHGPIALIDEQMPVVTIAPHDHVFEKMIGNMQEVEGARRLGHRADDARRRQAAAILDPRSDFVLELPLAPSC
jgi:glucosamine--fructose-6-phosphate aminotransferase (isomerizing)